MPRSDADSTSNALTAVGAPSETRIWQHYHDVLDEQGQPIVSNNRKSRVCNYCGHDETFTQMMLNIELEYDLASPIWEGDYVTIDTAVDIPALGQEDDAVPLDVDRDDLFAKLTQGM
ncbi:hypothetical protein ABBQ32_013047 [Trebouxia sp. C0010 RCD-2024]